jgi:hypothetical protein
MKIARRVYEDLAEHDCVVWAQEGYFCQASPDYAPSTLPSSLMAGTFRLGVPFDLLKEDLAYLRDSLMSSSMIDDGLLPRVKHGRGAKAVRASPAIGAAT